MDPNEALKNAREAAKRLLVPTRGTEGRDAIEDGEILAEAFEALDGWLTGGGFLPESWTDASKTQGGA